MHEVQETLRDARSLVATVYRGAGLIDLMKASAEQLDLDHDRRRPDRQQ
jgi:hypothetical protein